MHVMTSLFSKCILCVICTVCILCIMLTTEAFAKWLVIREDWLQFFLCPKWPLSCLPLAWNEQTRDRDRVQVSCNILYQLMQTWKNEVEYAGHSKYGAFQLCPVQCRGKAKWSSCCWKTFHQHLRINIRNSSDRKIVQTVFGGHILPW